jgi:hypothetical protein
VSALAALVLGALAVAYAVWPALRGPEADSLSDDDDRDAGAEITTDPNAIQAWSEAAGELEREAQETGPRIEGEGRET